MKNKKYAEYKLSGLCVRCGAIPENGKTRCETCNAEHLNYTKRSRAKAAKNGKCLYCLVASRHQNFTMCKDCLLKHNTKGKENYQKMRSACIEAYGKHCVCCGLNNPKYLQLDHINNDGEAHRKEVFRGNRKGSMYAWAYHNNFPDILQLLCGNCHQAKTSCGGCSASDHPKWDGHTTLLYASFVLIQ